MLNVEPKREETLGTTTQSERILVVDDVEESRYALVRSLKKAGYRVIEAGCGAEALMHAGSCPDLILLDVKLPDMSGFDVVARLRADPRCSRIPVIHISANYTRGEDHIYGVDSGADGFLVSPVDPLVLLSSVKAWLRVRKSELERESIERAHREVSEEMRLIADSVPTHLLHLDREERILFANKAAAEAWGRSVELLVGRCIGDIIGEEGQRALHDYTKRVLQGETLSYESPFTLPDGSTRTFLNTYSPDRAADGTIRGIVVTGTDITDRKRAELEVLHERERLYTLLMDAPVSLCVVRGPDLKFEFANELYKKNVGPDRELIGKRIQEALPELAPEVIAPHIKVFQTGDTYEVKEVPIGMEYEGKGKSYDRYWNITHQAIRSASGSIDAVLTSAVEVTEQILARQKIEESQRTLRAIFDQMPLGLLLVEAPSGKIVLGNDEVPKIFQHKVYPANQVEDYVPWKGFHPDGSSIQPEEWPVARSVQKGEVVRDEEIQIERGDGSRAIISVNSGPVRDSNGHVIAAIATIKDVTEKRLAKDLLERSRNQLHEFFMQSPIPMVILLGEEYRFVVANEPYEKLVGRKVVGKTVAEAFTYEEVSHFLPFLNRVYKTGESYIGKEMLLRVPDESGNLQDHYVNFGYHPFREPSGEIKGILAVAENVTEQVLARRKLEENRIELESTVANLKQERELRERFVSTLSHDLRTPLTAVKMNAQLLARKLDDPETVLKGAARIVDNVNRADQMIQDLLDANRLKAGERIPIEIGECSLKEIVSETLADLSTVHGDRFIFKIKDPFHGHWDCNGLRRILENLCNNAVKYGAAKAPVTILLEKDHESVLLHVHNEGPVIPPEEQPFLFEPFKRAGTAQASVHKGWGLGLTLVQGLAEAHGGAVTVESTSASGTTFTVILPQDARIGKPSV